MKEEGTPRKEERKAEWFNNEIFWEHFAPVLFNEERLAEVPEVCGGLFRLSGLDGPGLRVLDLCCGTGRISGELARCGCRVSGVDISPQYIERARRVAERENLGAEYLTGDIRDFSRPGAFGLVLNLYTSFGFFEDPADDALVLRNARESLADGGVFIMELQGKELAVRDIGGSEWFELEGRTFLLEYEETDSWAGLLNRRIYIEGTERAEYSFVRRLYAATELRSLLLDAGFSSVYFYGGWEGIPYDQNADTLIAVAVK